ncbi:MAG TPA: hypothetical protein VIM81_20600 [Gammaproteobacteria bacterium]
MSRIHAASALTFALGLAAAAAQEAPSAFELSLVSLAGEREVLGVVPGTVYAPRISNDGRRVVYDDHADDTVKVWVADIADLDSRRALPAENGAPMLYPLWSVDDSRVLYISYQGEEQTLFLRPANGTGSAELIASPARAPEAWSPDGSERYFDSSGRMYAAGVDTADGFRTSAPRALPIAGFVQQAGYRRQFDLVPDGERFLMLYAVA